MNDIKIILWCNDSPNQKALANKIAKKNLLSAIVIESRPSKRKFNFSILRKLIEKIYFRSIDQAWFLMLNDYNKKYPDWPKVDTLNVADINSKKTKEFTKKMDCDLICVSGTQLIKKEMFEVKNKFGIINLHTGLSPYVKGGPNSTNWCLSNNTPHLIGNTIMWLDEGIDSGNILTTESVKIEGDEDLKVIHEKVMESAHVLYIKVIDKIATDFNSCPRVPQKDITKGHIFYTKMWGWKEKNRLLTNLKSKRVATFIQSDEYVNVSAKIIFVKI